MANPELVEAPEGASKKDSYRSILKIIAQAELQKAATKEDMEKGNVWKRVDIIILSLVNFITNFYIDTNGQRSMMSQTFYLQHCGCEVVRMNIGKKKIL